MVKLQPRLDDIKARYEDEFEVMLKERKALCKREKYSAFKAILPLLIQIPIILGVIGVIYSPLKYILNIDNADINQLTAITREYVGESLETGADLRVIHAVHENPRLFPASAAVQAIADFKTGFLGFDLSAIPSLAGAYILIPLLSALSAFLMCLAQNWFNPLTKESGFLNKWGITIFLVMFSGYFAAVCPAGVGLYWIAGNLLGILVSWVCYLIYNPNKYIDYENHAVKTKLSAKEKRELKDKKRREKECQKVDEKRFFGVKKEIVFYAESRGFYKYFKGFIQHILDRSDIVVHYVTSDIDDPLLSDTRERFESYFCSVNGLITLFMKMDCDIMVLTMPDLERYHIKRSLVKNDIEYIYADHGIGSFHLMLRKGALDYYDTIFCYSKNHDAEIRATERLYGTQEKKLVNVGFGLLDENIANYERLDLPKNEKPRVLIAPSWQKDNLLEYCFDELAEGLRLTDYKIIIRPHPEFVKRFPGKMKLIFNKCKDFMGDDFEIQTDFSSNSTVYSSDLVITDWSSIAQEFSFATKKPVLFINTPMKVMNPEWKRIDIVPQEISIRDIIGISVDADKLGDIDETVRELITNAGKYRAAIENFIAGNMYNVGHAAEVGGEYLIAQVKARREAKNEEDNELPAARN
jgi:YidC/Oxa1 family membrane protein insertase